MKQNDDLEKFFKDAKERAQKLEKDQIEGAKIDPTEEATLRERLYRMIEYGIRRHDWYDDQRHRFLQIGLALMAAGVAICAVFSKLVDLKVPTEVISWIFGIVIFCTGLYLVYLYNKGVARSHPYRKISDIRSWYFVYNFPSGLRDHLSEKPDDAKREVNEVIAGLQVFLDRWLELTKDRLAFIKEDLEQVFILQLLQSYRHQQVKAMSSALYRGLKIAALFLLLVFVSFLVFDLPAVHMSNQNVKSNQIKPDLNRLSEDTTAVESPQISGQQLIQGQVKATNKSKQDSGSAADTGGFRHDTR